MKNKSIWHSAQEIPLFDDTVVFIDDLNNWHTGYTQRDNDGITDHDSGEIYTEENVLRWAYIKDLLALEAELEDTRKALDVAVDALKSVRKCLCEMPDPSGATILRMACESATTVKKALEQITALEQKD